MECIECGKKILQNEEYYSCLDNFLQVNYFDTEEENIFCSKRCFCEALSLIQLENEECDELKENEDNEYDLIRNEEF